MAVKYLFFYASRKIVHWCIKEDLRQSTGSRMTDKQWMFYPRKKSWSISPPCWTDEIRGFCHCQPGNSQLDICSPLDRRHENGKFRKSDISEAPSNAFRQSWDIIQTCHCPSQPQGPPGTWAYKKMPTSSENGVGRLTLETVSKMSRPQDLHLLFLANIQDELCPC